MSDCAHMGAVAAAVVLEENSSVDDAAAVDGD